jgi:hypothetical protein
LHESGGALRFSADDLPERDRLPIWREAFGRAIVKMDTEPIGDGPFRSRADIQMLPNLSIAADRSHSRILSLFVHFLKATEPNAR